MSNYSKKTKQDIEYINEADSFEGVSNDNRELFRRAISEGLSAKIDKILEEYKDIELPPPSKRYVESARTEIQKEQKRRNS